MIRVENENQRIERLLNAKLYFVKAWAALELMMINDIEKSADLKENLLYNLGTVAIIGSLFGGANLVSFMSGVSGVDNTDIGEFIGSVRFTSAGAGLTAAFYSAVIMSMTNAIPKVIQDLSSLVFKFLSRFCRAGRASLRRIDLE